MSHTSHTTVGSQGNWFSPPQVWSPVLNTGQGCDNFYWIICSRQHTHTSNGVSVSESEAEVVVMMMAVMVMVEVMMVMMVVIVVIMG